MNTAKTYGFVKRFENKAHAESLLYKGELHCKTLQYFKKLEENQTGNRADKNEGLMLIQQLKDLEEVTIDGVPISISDLTSPIKIHQNGYDKCNIYCLTSISTDGTETSIDDVSEKFKLPSSSKDEGLGDYVVYIKDPVEFLNRVAKKLQELKLKGKNKKISYVDLKESIYIKPEDVAFTKDKSEYGHQNEYRLMFYSNLGETLTIEIGSLKDIADLVTVEGFNNLHRIEMVD